MNRSMIVSIATTFAAFAAALIAYFGFYAYLAERIPVHWNLHMEPDAFAAREEALIYFLLFPGMMAAITALTFILPRISPRSFDVKRFDSTFSYVMLLIVVLFAYLFAIQICMAFEVSLPGLDRLFVGGFFLFFALLGNVLGKVQRNFWLGVRTPWTLASDAVWERTHRFAAWLWLVAGSLGFIAVLAGIPFAYCFALLIAAIVAPVVHSFVIWRRRQREGHAE